jgi:hypothetical protein
MTRLVRVQAELEAERAKLKIWKRAQASEAFHKVGESGKTRLDSIRAYHHEKIDAFLKQQERLLSSLVDVPEKACTTPGLPQDFETDRTLAYDAEGQQWISEIRKLCIKITSEAPPQHLALTGNDRDLQPSKDTPSFRPTLEAMRSRCDTLKNDIDQYEGDTYIADFTTLNNSGATRTLEEGECDLHYTPSSTNQYGELLQRVRVLSGAFGEQSVKLAKHASMESGRIADMATLKIQCDQLRASNAQVQ